MGCPSPFGRPCSATNECASGYTCVVDSSAPSSPYICARACVHNSDCGAGVDCRSNNTDPHAADFCNDFGVGEVGAMCMDWSELRECGPGLTCGRDGRCVRACDIESSAVADRMCPAGTTCSAEDRAVESRVTPPRVISFGHCQAQCDPAAPNACPAPYLCRRWISPGIGEVATCLWLGEGPSCPGGFTCPDGQICQDNVCYEPVDAPPRRPEDWFPPLSTPIE